MKKTILGKAAAAVLFLCTFCTFFTLPVSAESNDTVTFSLRIEGINETIFCDNVTLPTEDGTLTLQEAIVAFDEANDDVTVTGATDDYITDINGDAAGCFGGWDGWLFMINETSPVAGMSGCTLNNGDEVLFYYGDPFGIGMQFPVINTDNIKEGIISFISSDTTYAEDFTPIVKENPVIGMTVILSDGNSEKEFTTDSEGKIDISASGYSGATSISIKKVAENGCPLVLRLAPGTSVELPTNTTEAPTEDASPSPTKDAPSSTEKTDGSKNSGCGSAVTGSLSAILLVAVILFTKKKTN